jgi:hypothetical protein
MQPPSFCRCHRPALLRGWLLLLTLGLLVGGSAPSPGRAPTSVLVAEEATPDCPAAPPLAAPALQRAQHLARLGVDRWHAAGHRGAGVKVAVLDSGFRGYRACLGKALPARVVTRSFRADGDLEARDSQHGILCAEVVHALAPEAELLLANWDPDSPEQFLEALRWARTQGARVVSCSLIMPSWSDGEGGGAVNEAVARVAGAGGAGGDLLCFASAGNTAQRHWCGASRPDGAGLHQWGPGQTGNALKAWGHERVAVELYAQAGTPYEVVVRDRATGEVVGREEARAILPVADAAASAVVRFLPRRGRLYEVLVRCAPGQAGRFHLVVLGGWLECTTCEGSIPCPADGPAAVAVGAVDTLGHRLFYSSCGPNSRRPKPELVAEVPFPSLLRGHPFTGTSAAAPQAAGLAALLWSRHPDWTAGQVRAALLASARDLGPPGHDWETGYGRVTLP